MKFVLAALATHRLTYLLTEDKILDPYRNDIFDALPPTHTHLSTTGPSRYIPNPSFVLTCPRCASLYAAAAATLLAALSSRSRAAAALLTTLAAADTTLLIHEHFPTRNAQSGW